MATRVFLFLLNCLLFSHEIYAQPKSWLTCPPSLDMSLSRTGNAEGPCENKDFSSAYTFSVNAGDRIKVGWPSGNRGGGWVRLSLVPIQSAVSQKAFNDSVLKITCFGHDERPNRFFGGNCVHPCNGRGGCFYQNTTQDVNLYDTTITIPTNLVDGNYILQWIATPGGTNVPIYSCSKLKITGGDPNLTCSPPSSIPSASNCLVSNNLNVDTLTQDSKVGDFCYDFKGSSSIDAGISDLPVNVDCDPRQSCELSVNPNLCALDLPSILSPETSPHQSCSFSTTSRTTTSRTTSRDSTSSTREPTTTSSTTFSRSTDSTFTKTWTTEKTTSTTETYRPLPSNDKCIKSARIIHVDRFCSVWNSICQSVCDNKIESKTVVDSVFD